MRLRLLLDEHYPRWLADQLVEAGVDAESINTDWHGLQGADDTQLLQTAASDSRVVVTEDVRTFSVAATAVPDHCGIVYVHHARFPRTRPGLAHLRNALVALAAEPPAGLGEHPVLHWLNP